jgi:hypothetical protein
MFKKVECEVLFTWSDPGILSRSHVQSLRGDQLDQTDERRRKLIAFKSILLKGIE